MSSLIGKFLTILGLKRREANILVVGLDNSGKSTILNYLKRKEDQVEEVVPTVGFTVERLSGLRSGGGNSAAAKAGLTLTAFDMSGQGRYRNLWEHYYGNVEGIIFVVDSTDALRLVVARDELEMMLKHQQLQIEAEGGGGGGALLAHAKDSFESAQEDNEDEEEGQEESDGEKDRQKEGEKKKGQSSKQQTVTSRLASKNNRKTAFTRNHSLHSSAKSSAPPASSKLKSSASNSSLALPPAPPSATFRRADIPILFFANKMDLKEALPSLQISQLLGLHAFPHKNWHIQASNAISGEGVAEGVEWLIYQIASHKKGQSAASSSIHSSASSNSISSSK